EPLYMDGSQQVLDPALAPTAILMRLVVVAALVFTNAFFVAAEFALVSVRRSRIEELASNGNTLARVVKKAIGDIDRYIAGTQLGITIASLGLGWVGESTLAALLAPQLLHLGLAGGTRAVATAHQIAITLSFLGITFMHVVLGELVPKSVALQYPEKTALWIGQPMQFAVNVMRPLIWALNSAGALCLRILGIRVGKAPHQLHTVEELKILVDASHKGGVLDGTEREILQRVFRFSEVMARQVMVHRTQMQCIPADSTYEELAQAVEASPYTRLPVYEDSIDNIVGVLHLRDLFRHARSAGKNINVRALMHPPLFVPETLSLELLLNEFKRKRTQLAIVLDEFGGTAGLVTLKDVLDEIVGHVSEEFEAQEEPDIVRGEDGAIRLKGNVRIDDLNNTFQLHIEEPDADTVGGLVMNRLGRMPATGDEVTADGVRFRVDAVNGLRISRVTMQVMAPVGTEAHHE
ncbi:MAG TPA: hemolysin family protein, partial [Armatimonadota bacterium]|nr:hemolysin family protein [Armatimonadota bacterium]